MTYDEESNIAYWEVAKGKINHVAEFGNFIIHLSKTRKPILIEILNASKFIGEFDDVKEIKEKVGSMIPATSITN